MKVSNIRVQGMGEMAMVKCLNCGYLNKYTMMSSPKFQSIRVCRNCRAILSFDCEAEEVKE